MQLTGSGRRSWGGHRGQASAGFVSGERLRMHRGSQVGKGEESEGMMIQRDRDARDRGAAQLLPLLKLVIQLLPRTNFQ